MTAAPRGALIVFEGIDGAGKTTQAVLLEEHMKRRGFATIRSKEPTDGPHGQLLKRSALEGRLSPERELEEFMADRREHIESTIRPALDAGSVAILDRYFLSTAVYQGARGLNAGRILRDNEAFAPIPDLLFLLEIDAATAMQRVSQRGGAPNHFERLEYLARCAEIFASLDRPYIVRIVGTRSIEEIHEVVLRATTEKQLTS